MKSINLSLLRAFHAVAAQGSFTRAAKVMNVTQPTLSQQVKLLEETYGVRLLERSGRGVAVTALGNELFVITRRLFAAEQGAEELLSGARQLETGRLAIGADGPFHVLPLMRTFQERHPGPEVVLSVGNSAAILGDLFSTKLDIVVISELPGDARLFAIPLRRDPIVVMVPKAHRLARRRALTMPEIAEEPLILREKGSVTRQMVERALAANDLTPRHVMVIESREAVREAVANGLGLGFVSIAETMPDPRLLLLPIQGTRVEMDEYVACLRERRRLAIVRAFLQVAEDAAQSAAARPPLLSPG